MNDFKVVSKTDEVNCDRGLKADKEYIENELYKIFSNYYD